VNLLFACFFVSFLYLLLNKIIMSHFFTNNIWLIPIYTLSGILLSTLWFPGIIKKTGPRPSGYLNIVVTVIAWLHSLLALKEIWGQPTQLISFSWLQLNTLYLSFDIEISTLTIGALVLITTLNLASQIYAIGYLEMDWGWARFFALMGLFEAGMCSLILCDNLFFSYVILEILTLGTYLLIGFWFNQSLVVTGARDAFLTKRVGDLFLLIGVVALLPLAGTWNFHELENWAKTADINTTTINLLCLTLMAGPLGKCAQFPLHLWLDEAMESPVPATILRNSLVVAAGGWVLIKLQPIFALSSVISTAIITVGAITAVGASLIAIAQIDLKRSLSYSVSAYMGLLFIAVGTQQAQTILFVLLTYAVAMALLVMSVGSVVLTNITQDLTQYGGLFSRRPITAICYLIGAASLVAFPPLGGFWSLSQINSNLWENYPFLVLIITLVNGLTTFSVTREFCLIFGGKPKQMTVRSPEGLWALVLPTTITAGISIHIPIILAQLNLLPSLNELNIGVIISLILSTFLGALISAYIYLNDQITKPIKLKNQALQNFFAYDMYTPELYRVTIISLVAFISKIIDWFDRYFVDGLVNLVGFATIFSGESLKYNTTGKAQFYALSIVIGLALFILLICFPLLPNLL
jgi:NAD(P)H-quinone oxidoreductase subunit 5